MIMSSYTTRDYILLDICGILISHDFFNEENYYAKGSFIYESTTKNMILLKNQLMDISPNLTLLLRLAALPDISSAS